MERLALLALLLSLLCVCNNHNRYTVIERTNSDSDSAYYVPVVLQHGGHRYYARCNNFKAVADPKVTLHCNLHVGQTVECQFFESGGYGYDLICGSKRNEKGDLDVFGENDLLTVDKEVN